MGTMRHLSCLLLAALLWAAAAPLAAAGEGDYERYGHGADHGADHGAGDAHDDDYDGRDQERARAALERGEVLSLDVILARARELLDGRMIEAELEREDGRWVYELTLLGPDGRVVEALFDAASAELLELEGDGLERVLRRRSD